MSKQLDDLAAKMSTLAPEQRARLESILGRKMLPGSSAKTILCDRRTTVAPLSFAQLRVRFLDRIEPGGPLYNVPAAIRILGALDIPALAASLTEIVRRHEALRTTFCTLDNEPVQVINAVPPFALSIQDLSDRPPLSWELEASHRVSAEVQRPFDLSCEPVFRASLLCFDAQTHVLILNVHHIVADGWSISILHRELGTLYLNQQLPAAIVPASFVMLDALPLTPSGKLDRRALSLPDNTAAALQANFVAPRTSIEELLAGIWADVLKRQQVGVHDNFFELGGHSLLVTQVVARIRQALQADLPLRALFEYPTVSGLAASISQSQLEESQEMDPEEMERLLAALESLEGVEQQPAGQLYEHEIAVTSVSDAHSIPACVGTDRKFSCVIIGEGTLALSCADELLRRGHHIAAFITADAQIRRRLGAAILPVDPRDDLVAVLSVLTFDYIFSINNDIILPAAILRMPSTLAINYHDAPLPRYAGRNATSWALAQREKTHGVTWHLMASRVDAGDIVKQTEIAIAHDDTALSLNLKCLEAAIHAFTQLIAELESNTVQFRRQAPERRTFYAHEKRPAAGCVLSWRSCAHDIDAWVRALNFGPYPNPLGVAKFLVNGKFICVQETQILDSASISVPGTITHIDDKAIRIATISFDLALHKLFTLNGEPLSIADFVDRHQLHLGQRLPEIDAQTATRITELYAVTARHQDYWVERLTTIQDIELPGVVRKNREEPSRFASVAVSLPERLMAFLAARRWDREDFLLAVFGVYLTRISGADRFDIRFTGMHLQTRLAGLPELFAADPPLRMAFDKMQDFTQAFRTTVIGLEAMRQRFTYTQDIVDRYPVLAHSRSGGGLNISISMVRVADMDSYRALPGSVLTIVTSADECCWIVDESILSHFVLTDMLKQFRIMLDGIIAHPQTRLFELPLLTDTELHRLLVDWNNTDTDYPQSLFVHQLFEAQVARTPDAIALVMPATDSFSKTYRLKAPEAGLTRGHEEIRLSYRELNGRANQLAHYLQKQGVGPEVLVGICVERAVEMIVGMLGTLKAGGAYVPLDPAYPRQRLAFMLCDTAAPVLLTQQHLVADLPGHDAELVCLDSDWELIAQQSSENPVSGVTAENLAYVIYTSGSTGKPKGVMITHGSLVNFSADTAGEYGLASGDRVLQFASISFDASVEEIYPCLIRGATLVLRTDEMLGSACGFLQSCHNWQLSVLVLPTAYWHDLVAAIRAENLILPSSLRLVIIGGEQALAERLAIWQQHAGKNVRLLNTYGPTETTVIATRCELSRAETLQHISIGRPTANARIYLLDSCRQPVPIGSIGELYIGGAGLARAYLNRSELTAEKFVPHPFDTEPNARLYKTGDLARYLPDGTIEFLGRIDDQVKMRGFRIEPGEIEALLMRHPAVHEAIIIAREDSPGDKRLVAYIVTAPGSRTLQQEQPMIRDLRSFLKDELPEHMIPAAFVILDELPLTPSGKIDRKALPAPDQSCRELEVSFVAPRTPTEGMLAGIWAEVLKLDRVGRHDDFFELGGHSLLATQIVSRVRATFHIELPLRVLFESPTVASLAVAITAHPQISAPETDELLRVLDELEALPTAQTLLKL